ncbi:MAG: EAL domain-containing protein [Solirubrobacterales bacterium]
MKESSKNKFVSLRTKTVILLIIIFIIISASIFILLNTIMMNRINQLEDKYVIENVKRVQVDINGELEKLNQLSHDWASWDDTYYFIDNNSKEYIISNLNKETIRNLKINVIMYINGKGEIIYGSAMDGTSKEIVPVSQEFIDKIKESPIINNSDPEKKFGGILMLSDGAMLLSSNPILKSDNEGPIRGNLIMGSYLNSSKISEIAKDLNLNVSIERMNGVNSSDNIIVENLNDNEIQGVEVLKDIYNKPAIKIKVLMNKEISSIGRQGIEIVILCLILITFATIILGLKIFDKEILMRLESLCLEIRDIGKRRMFSKRLNSDKKNDEISDVTFDINEFLSELEEYQQQIIQRDKKINDINKNLEVIVMQRTNELLATNKSLHQEIMHRCEMQQKIKKIAYHDYLTDLPNRLLFIEQLNNAIKYAKNLNKLVTVMFLDLDSFKMINDSMGHAIGDELLKEVAARLMETVKQSDMVARIGGDEFVLLVRNVTDLNGIKAMAEKILDSFYEPFTLNDQDCFITTSIGIATFPMDGEDSETLLKNADIAMYNAKEKGKNQYVFCAQVKKAAILENMKLKNKLYRAIENNELELYYQPQINCITEEITGIEALLRWNNPGLGDVSREKFIPIAEQTGLIIPIGNWVMKTAFKHNRILQDHGFKNIPTAVNLSIKQFQNKDIVRNVQEALIEADLDPKFVEIEITESVLLKEQNYIIDSLNRFRDLGIKIAIDDFGTEYSSLNYLKHLPIDRIKIAMQFVQGIQINEKDEAIIKAILVLAKNMGLGVVVEGVEHSYQLEFLKKYMCGEIQGYYFYKPMPFEKLVKLLKDSNLNSERDA